MKRIILLLFALPAIAFSQQSVPAGSSIKQMSLCKWDATNGLPYRVVQGANLGVTAFAVLDKNRIAYLSDASNEIIITDQSTGSIISRFPVVVAPRDFVYDNGGFYVLGENAVTVYDEKGNITNSFSYPATYVGIERLTRYNNSTYLLLPSGYSVKIESNGASATPAGYKGWVTGAGYFVSAKISGGNSYSVNVTAPNGKSYDAVLTATRKVGGVYVVGATANRIYLDVQTYVTESPISVERHIVSVELTSTGLGNIITDTQVPDCYYVLSNREFYVSASGMLLNMVTVPQGTYVFSHTETEVSKAEGYPSYITAVKYHFNDHLLQVDEK